MMYTYCDKCRQGQSFHMREVCMVCGTAYNPDILRPLPAAPPPRSLEARPLDVEGYALRHAGSRCPIVFADPEDAWKYLHDQHPKGSLVGKKEEWKVYPVYRIESPVSRDAGEDRVKSIQAWAGWLDSHFQKSSYSASLKGPIEDATRESWMAAIRWVDASRAPTLASIGAATAQEGGASAAR